MQNRIMKTALGVALLAAAGATYAQKEGNSFVLSSASGETQVSNPETTQGTGPGAGYETDGTESWDAIGSPNNVVVELDIGAGNAVTGASFDVTIQTAGSGSWCSEAAVLMSNSDGEGDTNGIFLTPAIGEDAACDDGLEVSSEGVIDFASNDLPNIEPNADGILRLEFHESFDDETDVIDAFWFQHSDPFVVQGLGFACTDQAACDAAVGGGEPAPEAVSVPAMDLRGMIILGVLALLVGGLVLRGRVL